MIAITLAVLPLVDDLSDETASRVKNAIFMLVILMMNDRQQLILKIAVMIMMILSGAILR